MYTIGNGGYVKRLHCDGSNGLPVSVWCMTYNILRDKRVILHANQCADQDGRMLPPDVISGQFFLDMATRGSGNRSQLDSCEIKLRPT